MFKSRFFESIKTCLLVLVGLVLAGVIFNSNPSVAPSNRIGQEYQLVSNTKYKIEFKTSRGDFCVGFVSTYSNEAVALACDFQGAKE